MLKRTCFVLAFLVSACVTVNIYFPAAAVERAADQIVKETWGDPGVPPRVARVAVNRADSTTPSLDRLRTRGSAASVTSSSARTTVVTAPIESKRSRTGAP